MKIRAHLKKAVFFVDQKVGALCRVVMDEEGVLLGFAFHGLALSAARLATL